jgi:hypothetical protein
MSALKDIWKLTIIDYLELILSWYMETYEIIDKNLVPIYVHSIEIINCNTA